MENSRPVISVVMGVYNGGDLLFDTIKSVLNQDYCNFELVIVNDGSIDATREVLEQYAAADMRIRLLHKTNEGLTAALADGCAIARGTFIARQDVGDISMPSRLGKLVDVLTKRADVSLVSCGSRFVDPDGELLYEVVQSDAEATLGFRDLTMSSIRGPSHHGSTMFRKSDYDFVGGYRRDFQVAQDIDLWTRLVEIGRPAVVDEVLYIAEFSYDGISTWKREQQLVTMELILECARARRNGHSEEESLSKLPDLLSVNINKKKKSAVDSGYFCFVGSCLKNRSPDKARIYFKKSLQLNPLNFRALYHWLTT